MDWWIAGAALVAALVWALWDVSRPGRATGAALLTLRAVGGLALLALAAHALDAGATAAAAIAAAAATPLILGLFGGIIATRTARTPTPARRPPAPLRAAPQRHAGAGRRAA